MSQSPTWKPSSGIVKLRKKKRRDKNVASPMPDLNYSKPGALPSGGKKRLNPFSDNEVNKKINLGDTEALSSGGLEKKNGAQSSDLLFSLMNPNVEKLDSEEVQSQREVLEKTEKAAVQIQRYTDELASITSQPQKESETVEEEWHEGYPVDWCMRSRLRCVSTSPFNWCYPLKTAKQVAGTSAFMTGGHFELCKAESDEPNKIRFSQICHYWQHPNLPWMRMFPRYESESKGSQGKTTQLPEDVQKALYSDWSESFTSAYNMVKYKACPYFYMLAHQMSVLFRNTQPCGMEAFVSPTTKGFRSALAKEGVEISMPLCPAESTADKELDELEEEETKPDVSERQNIKVSKEEDTEDEEDTSSWIHTMGFTASDFPALEPRKLAKKDKTKSIDKRAESVIYVKGSDTQALFNYLLNCKSCIATTGNQAGIPPTILAPIGFKGATLRALQVRQGSLRSDSSTEKEYNLEMTGPILPTTIHCLTSLLEMTQGSFYVNFSNHDTTLPYNCNVGDTEDKPVKMKRAEYHPEWLDQPSVLGKHSMSVLVCQKGQYKWNL